ncbi:MAG: transglutaminase domain-containing protein [Christensenellales bacterium]|jgi:transglutaminase-like putative cysteine protease
MKKVLFFVCLCLIVLCMPARAEGAVVYYTGDGVYVRVAPKITPKALLDELNIASCESDTPFLTVGQLARWTVEAVGGDGVYSFTYTLMRETETPTYYSSVSSIYDTYEKRCAFYIETPGRYLIKINLYDETGALISYLSPPVETASASDYENENTLAGKVKSLAAQCEAECETDYQKVLWVHDYLTHNAQYDLTKTYYMADGVLLHGTGVCQSYATAFDLLMKELGIASRFIGGENHAWNMVQLSGKWYHIDCTWDDPIGGSENHAYFLMPDSVMALDHEWLTHWQYVPKCTDSFGIEESRYGATVVYTEEELTSAIDGAIRDRAHYLGLVDVTNGTDLYNAAAAYLGQLIANGSITNFSDVRQNGAGIYLYFNYGYEAASPAPLEMYLTRNDISLSVGESAQTGVAFYPAMVFDFVSEGMESGGRRWKPAHTLGVEWSSESERIATVDQTGTVTGIRPGTARIQARCGALLCAFDAMVMGPVTEIREGIRRIEDEAFMGCDSFTRVVLPESLLSVGSRAFANCAALREVVFQNDDVSIADDAFSGTTDLTFVCDDATGNVAQYALQRGFRVRQE